jgi:NB-ARC domain
MKEFIGRVQLMDRLWFWLVLEPDQPRLFLYGDGGSGKSTLAYEFARCVASSSVAAISSEGSKIDFVVYLSGKKTEIDPKTGKIREFAAQDFTSAEEQFRKILNRSGWMTEAETQNLSKKELLRALKELLSEFYGLIVLDDIDTLARSEDPGMDDLFKLVVTTKPGAKLLYTLRNEPKFSQENSEPVPGLDPEDEYPFFIDACAKQFKVPYPDPALMMVSLDKVSGRLPLVIETILGLRRRTGSYQQAITLYQEGGGRDARENLFQREYDFLGADNRARHLLAALSLFDKPVDFDNLRLVLNFAAEQLSDAIGEISDIFLATEESLGSQFEVRAVARPFLKEVTRKLDRFSMIETRVKAIQSSSVSDSPEVSKLRFQVEELLNNGRADEALHVMSASPRGAFRRE